MLFLVMRIDLESHIELRYSEEYQIQNDFSQIKNHTKIINTQREQNLKTS